MAQSDDSPEISEDARQTLLEEVKDAAGAEAFEEADLDVDRAISDRPRPVRAAFESSRLLLILTAATALTVGVIAALATGSWWLLGVALLVHGLLTAVVISASMTLFSQAEKPDPAVVTKLEDEGVEDPEPVINSLVEEVADQRERRAQ